MKKSNCVYCIENVVNGKVYIGIAVNLNRRLNDHYNCLINNKHYNTYLQRSWNKYGEKNFLFSILKDNVITVTEMKELEMYYIKLANSNNNKFGYNKTSGGDFTQFTQEMKDKCSLRMKGKPKSEEQKRKISLTHKKNPIWKGKKQSEHSSKLKSFYAKNQKQSEKTKKKRALTQTGVGNHRYGKPAHNRTAILVWKLDGTYIGEFEGQRIASKILGVRETGIFSVLSGKCKYSKGYIFKYRDRK
jgi:group I intron endonuclease